MVSHAERRIFLLNVLKDLVIQDLDEDHIVRFGAPYDTPFSSERTLEDQRRPPEALRVNRVQVPGRYSDRLASLHFVFPPSDRCGGFRVDFVLWHGHIQQHIYIGIQSPVVPVVRIANLEYRFISDQVVLVFEDPFFRRF